MSLNEQDLDYDQPFGDDPEARSYAVEGNDLSGYVGVSPEYMTYANPTEAPLVDGAEGPSVEDAEVEDEPVAPKKGKGKPAPE